MATPRRPAAPRSPAWLIAAGGLAAVALILAAAFGLTLLHVVADLIT